jgi:hypothetical protein
MAIVTVDKAGLPAGNVIVPLFSVKSAVVAVPTLDGLLSPSRDWANMYQPGMGKNRSEWIGTAPDAAAAGGATGFIGAGGAVGTKGGC